MQTVLDRVGSGADVLARRRGCVARRGGASNVLVGCLVILFVILLLLGVGGWYVAQNWRGWVATGMESAMEAGLDEAGLPKEQADALRVEFTALIEDFRAERISIEQLGRVVEEVFEDDDVIAMAVVQGMGMQYVKHTDLPTEQGDEARAGIHRFAAAMKEGKIEQSQFKEVLEPIQSDDPNAAIQVQVKGISVSLKPPSEVTPEEVRALVANLNTAADEAGVAPEVEPFDFAAYVKSSIDRALGRSSAHDGHTHDDDANADHGGADHDADGHHDDSDDDAGHGGG